jgi:hypothetical protein
MATFDAHAGRELAFGDAALDLTYRPANAHSPGVAMRLLLERIDHRVGPLEAAVRLRAFGQVIRRDPDREELHAHPRLLEAIQVEMPSGIEARSAPSSITRITVSAWQSRR